MVFDVALGALETQNVVRWPLVAGATVLALIWLGFRARRDIAEAMGFADADVALLTIGSLAAPVLSVPVWIVSDAVFAVNLGGALIPLLLAWRLHQRGVLPIGRTLLGSLPVAAAAWWVVEVEPTRGVVAGFPEFLLPPLVALAAGLALAQPSLERAGPIAFIAGALGAFVGADLIALPRLLDVAAAANPGTAFIVGGGGAFDLVFLSGAIGLAASLGIAVLAIQRPAPGIGQAQPPLRVPDPREVLEQLEGAPGVSPRERCLIALAKANLALETDRLALAAEHARSAADALLSSGSPRLIERIRTGEGVPDLAGELRVLDAATRIDEPGWVATVDAVEQAKQVAGRLFDHAEGRVRATGWTR